MTAYAQRRDHARERLGEEAEVLLVTTPLNVRYLTGFTGSNAQLLLDPKPLFFTDGRYQVQSAAQVPDLERVVYSAQTKFVDLLAGVLTDRGITRVAVEAANTTLESFDRLVDALGDVEVARTTNIVEAVRARKDDVEIDAMRRAQRVAESAVRSVLQRWDDGSESELALELEWAMREGGADGVSFEVIVATGPHAALPHATPRRERADVEGVLLVDIGAKLDGYCSDMTRTYLGPHATEEVVRAHGAVVRALEAGCSAVRPGAKAADVDRAAREVLDAEGLGDLFVHSTGHGVGLDIHEAPTLSSASTDVLEPGMVVTVEPGVYIPGVGGVRVEDLLVVTETGAENLTMLDRGPGLPGKED